MASTTVQSPPLSYAERARRAQNIKSKISLPPPQIHAPKGPTVTPSLSAVSSHLSAPSISPSTSSVDATTPDPSSVATSTESTVVATPDSEAPIPPAKSASAQSQLAAQALSIVAAHSPPAKPPQNVWSLRAAARAAAPPRIANTTSDAAEASSNWPQVGVTANGPLPPAVVAESRNSGTAAPSSASPRKGEKTKWVAIPPAELQAAADALKPRNPPSRKQPPRSGANNTAASSARNPSGRTSASQSRTQSRTASNNSSPRSGGRNASKKPLPNNDVSHLPSELASIPSTSTIPSHSSTHNQTPPPPLTGPSSHGISAQLAQKHASIPIFYPRSQRSPSSHSRQLDSPATALTNLVQSISSSTNTSTSTPSHTYPSHHSNPSISSASYGYASGPLDFNPSSGLHGTIPSAHQPSLSSLLLRDGDVTKSSALPERRSHPSLNHEELVSLVMRHRPEDASAADSVPTNGPALATINGDSASAETAANGVLPRSETMTFGSITVGETRKSDAPSTVGGEDRGKIPSPDAERNEDSEKMANGEESTVPRAASSPTDSATQGVAEIAARGPAGTDEIQVLANGMADQQQNHGATTAAPVPRQVSEVKYRFGTASNTPPPVAETTELSTTQSEPSMLALQVPDQGEVLAEGEAQLQASTTMPAAISILGDDGKAREAQVPSDQSGGPVLMDARGSLSLGQIPHPHHAHLSHPHPHHPNGHPATAASVEPPTSPIATSPVYHHLGRAALDPDLTVKDYGYGFGNPRLQQRERELGVGVERQREISAWMETHNRHYLSPTSPSAAEDGAEHAERMWGSGQGARDVRGSGDAPHTSWRGRRGGFGGTSASGSGARGGYGGASYGIGGSGRRGRGGNNGTSGFSRGYGRGRGGSSSNSQRGADRGPPPFTVTPPPHLQSLVAPSEYYDPRVLPTGYHHPMLPPRMNGFDSSYLPSLVAPAPPLTIPTNPPHASPPVPVPLSPISFPLDPTRYYLLGQLEYYLSPQNMASDFFLRQRMDSRGWIPIPLIASFNRVKQLTLDEVLVRDVLMLSSLVQVWGGMVRMGGWERYVLPDAAPSTVDEPPQPGLHFGQPALGGYLEQNHQRPLSPSIYDQRPPTELAETNGLQLHLGNDAPLQEEHRYLEESQAVSAHNGATINGDEKIAELLVNGNGHPHVADFAPAAEHEHEEEEDEEDDVVFVMGHEDGTWPSPERKA